MMTFQLRDTKDQRQKNHRFTWHTGEKIDPIVCNRISDGDSEVMLAQADGGELEWIRANITGIHMNKNRVVQWSGEDARFIVESLPVHWNK